MADRRTRLSDALGAGLCVLGAALVAEPGELLTKAGITVEDDSAELFARLLGLRDLALGAVLLSANGVVVRRRILRAVAVMAAVEAAVFALAPAPLSRRSRALAIGATLVAGAQAALASTSDAESPDAGAPLMVAGYLLSAAPSLRLAVVVRERDMKRFAAYEAGATLIALGWLQRRETRNALVNTIAAAGGALWWTLARWRDHGNTSGKA